MRKDGDDGVAAGVGRAVGVSRAADPGVGVWQRLHELLLARLHQAERSTGRERQSTGRTCGRLGAKTGPSPVDRSRSGSEHHWVVKRTIAWLHQYRRLRVRYARRDDIHEAFLAIGAA